MRKIILLVLLSFASAQAWATGCSVSSVYVSDAGLYSTNSPPSVIITGPGTGGATAYANMTASGPYWLVSSVIVTAAGSYTGPVTVTFIGGSPVHNAAGHAVMSGSCGSGGRNRFAWLL